jgi:hypothetical protein
LINRNKGQSSGFSATIAVIPAGAAHPNAVEGLSFELFPDPGVGKSRRNYMAGLFNLVMLVCAILGSMAFGVLTAYGVFRVAFFMMRPRPRSVAVKAQAEAATLL